MRGRTSDDVAPSNFEGPRTTTCKCNATEGIDDCTCNLRKERFCFGLAQNRQCTRSAQLALQGSSREGGYPPAGTRNLRNERSCFGLALQGSSREGGYPPAGSQPAMHALSSTGTPVSPVSLPCPHARGDATTPEGAVATGSALAIAVLNSACQARRFSAVITWGGGGNANMLMMP